MGHGYNFREKTESAGPKGMGAKTLRRLEITPGKNGGHSVNHVFNYNAGPGPSHSAEEHIFGASEGPALVAHIVKHLGIKGTRAPAVAAPPTGGNTLE